MKKNDVFVFLLLVFMCAFGIAAFQRFNDKYKIDEYNNIL